MMKRATILGLCAIACLAAATFGSSSADAAPPGQPNDWQRFYYYPYVYYPHNFQQIPESYDHMYYRYPVQKQIPVYNTDWHNFYPTEKPWYSGHHYIMDVF